MMRLVGRLAAAIGISALCFTTGCAGFFVYPGSATGGGTTTGDYVYVANATSNTIGGFAVGTGTLTALANSPYALGYSPTALVVNPANSILFVSSNSQIYAYAISSSNGSLSLLSTGGVAGYTAVSMDVSPDGQWLLVLDGNGLSIDVLQINSSTGALTPGLPVFYASTPATPRSIKIAPNGALVFVALGTGGDMIYTFNTAASSGALTNAQTFATLTAPASDNALAINSTSTTLYIARSNSTSAGSVAAYTIANGGVSLAPAATGTTGVLPSSVVVNPGGTDVYVGNRSDGTVSGFNTTAASALLPALTGSPYAVGPAVTSMVGDKSGSYLLVAGGGSPDLTMYSYDATTPGKLDFVTSTASGVDPAGAVAIAATH